MADTGAPLTLNKPLDSDNAETAILAVATSMQAINDEFVHATGHDHTAKGALIPAAALAADVAYMKPIAGGIPLAAAAANIEFQNLPQYSGTLVAIIKGRGTAAADAVGLLMRLNGNADGAYDTQSLDAYGTTVAAVQAIGATSGEVGALASASGVATGVGTIIVTIPGYSQAGIKQGWNAEAGEVRAEASGGLRVHTSHGQWRYTDPITQLTFTPTSGNLGIGTVITIYVMPS